MAKFLSLTGVQELVTKIKSYVTTQLSSYINSVSASGTAPLTLSASVSSGKLTLTGSVATATTSAAGAMSASDKSKLDGLEAPEEITTDEIDELF